MNTSGLILFSILLGFGLLAVVCINLDAAGYSDENLPGGGFAVLFMAILFVAGPPLVIKFFFNQGRKDRAEAEKEYLKEKSAYDEALRKVEEYLASYGFGTLSNLKSEFKKAENSYFEFIAGETVRFNSDLRTVSNSARTLGVESPTVLPSPLRAAFIGEDRFFRPRYDTGKTAIDKILRECGEYVTVPPLPLKEKQIATGNDFTKVVKQNEATNEKAVSTNQGVEVTDAEEENILELEPISEFWVRRGKAMRGPVSRKVIKEALQQGKLDATDLIASHKNGPWVTLSEGVKQYGFNQATMLTKQVITVQANTVSPANAAEEQLIEVTASAEWWTDIRSLQLRYTLQRMESRCMIDDVVGGIIEDNVDIPVITIHDGILTTAPHIKNIKQRIKHSFLQRYGLDVGLSIKL